MEKEDSKKQVLIDLSDSTHAHSFAEQNRIHQVEFETAINLIENKINKMDEVHKYNNSVLNRVHNTISIFGDRGTGKTSFITSLFDEIEKRSGKVKILGLIDPTLMEEKAHIFLLIISMINDEVKAVIEKGTCEPGGEAYRQRMDWNACVKKLAKGLPSLDKVGKDYNNTSWQDDEFIMQKGLDDIMAAYRLEENFHKMVDMALEILGKDAFLVAFDDIDINMEKGWRVLETIRKYLTTPKIITLLSGNMYLYNLNVRGQLWGQFGARLLSKEKERDYNSLVNQLENQYMLKVFKAENRLHLHPLSYSIRMHGMEYSVKGVEKNEVKIEEAYQQVLGKYGISAASSVNVFRDYLMGLSIRSQINYLKLNWDANQDNFSISNIEAFLSRMYAAGIEIQLAYANPSLLNIIILTYLVKEGDNSLRDTYLLMPATDDPEMNACLTGLSTVFASQAANYPGLIFDYMIRIGYLRNLILSNSDQASYDGLINFASFKHDVSLKNIVGTSMAYKLQDDPNGDGLKGHKAIYGLNGRAKKKGMAKIDDVLKKQKAVQKLLGYLPLCALQYDFKNESQLYYSFYLLLGGIGTLLRSVPDSTNVTEEKDIKKIRENIKDILKDMAQLRSYSVPSKESGSSTPQDETEGSGDLTIMDDENLTEFAEEIRVWINAYYALKKSVPAYVIGRIVTRFHRTVIKIEADNLGDYMHRVVVAFVNACLIEECKEYLLEKHEDASLTKLNFNNALSSDKVLIDNLSYLSEKYEDTLALTGWIVASPLILPYINKELHANKGWTSLKNSFDEKYNVYDVLKQIGTKDSQEPFLYARDTFMVSYGNLLANGFDIQKLDVAEVTQDLIDELKDYFTKYVSKTSVERFIEKLKSANLAPFSEVSSEGSSEDRDGATRES